MKKNYTNKKSFTGKNRKSIYFAMEKAKMTLEEYTRLTEKYDNENSYYDGINPILENLTLEEVEELEKECLTQMNNN